MVPSQLWQAILAAERSKIVLTGEDMVRPTISVATTTYNSERCIIQFLSEMRRVLEEVEGTWEIIVVDDGSADESVNLCRSIADADGRITLVELSRNFGHEPALLEAMRQANGDFVFLIDSDLEEPPETLLEMLDILRAETTVDAVYGVQKVRRGTMQHTLLGWLSYRVFNKLSGVAIPNDVLTVRLMTRRYVDAILRYNERTIALAGLFALAGFEQRPLPVDKSYKGYTSYTFMKRAAVFLRYLIIFTSAPANAITAAGLVTAAFAAVYASYVLGAYWVTTNPVEGWTTLVLLILFFNGLLLTSIGICSAYLSYIFQEVKGRPVVIVKETGSGGHVAPIPRIKRPQ
jgi:putative glycosyltransferase